MIPLWEKMRFTGAEVAGAQRILWNNGIIAYFSAHTEERYISCLLPRTLLRTSLTAKARIKDLI